MGIVVAGFLEFTNATNPYLPPSPLHTTIPLYSPSLPPSLPSSLPPSLPPSRHLETAQRKWKSLRQLARKQRHVIDSMTPTAQYGD